MEHDKGSTQHVAFHMEDVTNVIREEDEEEEEEEGKVEHDGDEDQKTPFTANGHTSAKETGAERDQLPFLKARQGRYSVISAQGFVMSSRPSFGGMSSRPSFGGLSSRPSFQGLSSRPSMASLRSTISRVNSELYPERGSFVAFSLGHSFADIPPLARKMYIITQVLAALSVSMGSMAVGFTAAYTSPALESLDAAANATLEAWNFTLDAFNSTLDGFNFTVDASSSAPLMVTEEQKSWIGSLMPLSALFGSIIGGYLVDALGRKMVILICGPPFVIAYILIGSAINVMMIYIGRVLGGLCVGLLTLTLPVYLSETVQPEIRGILGLLPTTFGNAGILLCFLVGSNVNWWVLAYVGAIVPLVFTTMMCFVPETPRWYISKDRVEDARAALQWLRGSFNDVEFELEAIQINFELSSQTRSSVRDVFSRRHIRPFLLSMGLMLIQQLSGINAVIFYTVAIFKMSGSAMSDHLSTIIVGIVNLLSTFVANAVIDKVGRKVLVYISSVLMVVALVSLGSFFALRSKAESLPVDHVDVVWWEALVDNISWLPLVSFMMYVVAFSLGWGPIPWLFMGEALPAKVRGPAASMVTALNWSCTFIITKTFPGMIEALGPSIVFFMFSGIMVLGFLYAVFLVPETKGKMLEEIEEELSGRKKHPNRKISTISGLNMK